ncbi:alkaline phosphatase [Kaistella montana]|uniref:Alkaline phosphatase n=1 Tax=Kaistella montana TaxID=1849733 RepID=A0ABW5KC49_9FLAO|nr:alkaline phosphatase [Kaistella montana]MCQ4036044.1 alkaline phosphatase [Kaistella montana]
MRKNFGRSVLGISLVCASVMGFSQKKEPINVIMMIGDGMGVAQVSSAFYFGNSAPNFQQFSITGFSETSSTSHRITDSAAGATALSTGQKTYKRAIGVDKDSASIPTILEQLQEKNYKTGLISLTSVTHATPAAYYAHVKDRDLHEDIATQLVPSGVNFIAGGGIKYFTKRKDHVDLLKEFTKRNYQYHTSLDLLDPKKNQIYLLADEGLPSKDEGREDFLPEMTQIALDYFEQQKQPFFLMVEGSYIDWGGHAKNANRVVQEVLDFDKTIGVVIEFVKKNPNTLLIVTADHETGGVSLGKYSEKDPTTGKIVEVPRRVQIEFNTDQHTAALVPVFAMGKNQELFSGVYPNNEIYHKIVKAIAEAGVTIK